MQDDYIHPGIAQAPAVDATTYQMTLAGLCLRMRWHLLANGLGALSALLLGHPTVAAWGFVSCSAVDLLHRRLVVRWLARSRGADPERGFRRLAPLCALRFATYIAPAAWIGLGGQPAGLLLFAVTATTMVAIAQSAGVLSRLVFWSLVSPVLAAVALVALRLGAASSAAAVAISLSMLIGLLMVMTETSRRVIIAWHNAFLDNAALIPQLEAARDEALAERAAADTAREEARQATRAKANFLATMSHEIRTPMNGVLGMAQLMRRDAENPLQGRRLDILIESGEYLLSILNDILDVSKIDAGRLDLSPQAEDLHLFLQRLVSFWGAQADEKGVSLILDLSSSVPQYALIDALRLRQVLFNLVGNALKFTQEGAVEISASAVPNGEGAFRLDLAVKDTGIGIAPHNLPRLFDRFSQGDDTEARQFGGTGLGLAIAKQLVELMGGRISAESVVGHGSIFRVQLPLAIAEAPAPAAEPAQDEPAQDEPAGSALKVLAVDDNAVNLMVLEQILGSLGHAVAKATSGHEALAALAVEPFDLILLDIQMPGMSGVDVLARLRADEGPNRYAPVVALTADVTSGGRKRYLKLGFTEHAPKPIQIPDLVAAMARAVAADPRAQAA
jgi:signal transduction histidine kinase/CheY-like chemotaxis protein